MSSTTAILVLSSLGLIVGLILTYWLHSQHAMEVTASPQPLGPGAAADPVSLVVPARNEARNIRRCVQSLLAQEYPAFEVIVVDDRSTDATPQILARLVQEGRQKPHPVSLKVVAGEDLPPGWAGKPHALVQGARAAQGRWLCFVDADTFLHPLALASTYQAALACRADLFTILTDQELGSFWEKVVIPVVFTALSVGFPARRVNNPDLPDAIANGQYILIRREVYDAVGGHAAVKDRIDEDKGIAEVVKGAGFRLIIADGRQLASTRMYTGLAEMWEGWTKNIFVGMRGRLGFLLFGAIVALLGALLLPFWLAGGTAWFIATGSLAAALVMIEAVLLWGYLLYQRMLAARAFHLSPLYALSLPLGALVFAAMMAASTFKVLSRQGVSWRGRTYHP